MIIAGYEYAGEKPFNNVYLTGIVRDKQGRKMSKSLGNVIEPTTIINGGQIRNKKIEGYGVDVLRYWVASTDYTSDVNVSPELLEDCSSSLRKIRNTVRFILGNLYDYDGTIIPYSELLDIDKYALHLLAEFSHNITQLYDAYTFNKVIKHITYFTNIQLSAFYFDVIKDRLYTSSPKSPHRLSAQYVLNEIYRVLSISLAPILPHVTEDFHNNYTVPKNKPESIFHHPWFPTLQNWVDADLNNRWEVMRNTRTVFNKLYEEQKQKDPERVRATIDLDLTLKIPNNSLLHKAITEIGPQYGELFIVSNYDHQIINSSDELSLQLTLPQHPKCPRCWKKILRKNNLFCDKSSCPEI